LLQWILLALLSINAFALEISMDSAKDDFERYSTLLIVNEEPFVCQKITNDFEQTTEIICAFSKRPSQEVQKLQNDFFKVDSFVKKGTFFLNIKPFYKIKLIANIFDLTKDKSVYSANVSIAKEWNVIGYKEKLPLIHNRERPDISINFPFFLDKDMLPYVGSLDIKGNPVFIKKVADVKEYLKAKRYYQDGKYEQCMNVIDDILYEYPNTLFKAELTYYKIKLYAKLKDWDNVIAYSKEFIQEYSASENIPEVLSLIGQAYSQIGMNIDADYFFDRLFSEHPNSLYTEWGYIYKGEMLEMSGGVTKAVSFYKKALHKTKNLDVAATAAFDIAHALLETSMRESAKYIDKIIAAKPSYFHTREKESKDMMQLFVDNGQYETAAKIAKALLDAIDPTYDEYEELLSQWALWMAKTGNTKEALIALNRYLKEFPDGDYIDQVQIAKDSMFFETDDTNLTSRLADLDKLIEEYSNDTIGSRALYEKAKILLKMGKYAEVLAMKDDILTLDMEIYPDKESLIVQAAKGEMQEALKVKECSQVLVISHEYNITLSNEWDDGIYECAMKGGDYQLSKQMCEKNFKSSDLELRKLWLYRYIKVDFATGNYSDVIDASKDLIALIEDEKESKYKEVYRYLFDTYQRLEKQNEMIEAMTKIEEIFGLSYKDIDRYVAMIALGESMNDDTMIIKYATKVMEIQKASDSHAQSPYVEFTLYQAYSNKEDYNKAYEVIKSLDTVALNTQERARQKYLLGSILSKLWRDDEASIAYKEAIKADPNSAWAKLAKSALEI